MRVIFSFFQFLNELNLTYQRLTGFVASFYFNPNIIGALRQVSIVSHSHQTYFGFPGSDLNLDYGLRDQEIRISWYQS